MTTHRAGGSSHRKVSSEHENNREEKVGFEAEIRLLSGAATVAAVTIGMVSCAVAAPPGWCKKIADGLYCASPKRSPRLLRDETDIVALADGFADNGWRQQTTAVGINEASRCPNVTAGRIPTARATPRRRSPTLKDWRRRGEAIVVFPDGGPAILPAIRDAFKHGSAVVPYRARSAARKALTIPFRRHRLQE